MPIPSRQGNESEDSFIGRCMTAIGDEYPQDQALAICYDAFRGTKLKKSMLDTPEKRVLRKLNVINGRTPQVLIEPNPCWPGYEAIGTKMVDGNEVPNCVPVE